ncbi:FMN-linked oxidoreductase [Neoconidiobolus thromboides FSU 785]|nr:FMN-linked oxidoreductase [Neoconidiobolus thromboides FSU 785]
MTVFNIEPKDFVVEQNPTAGSNIEGENENAPLFSELTIKNLTINNRVAVSPMCTYSSKDGFMTNWHLVHYGQFALHGAGLIIVEATAVSEEGRITPYCAGIWKDEHMEKLTEITTYVHQQGGKIGIQIGHSGRKGSTFPLYHPKADDIASREFGGWDNIIAPSAIAWDDQHLVPIEMTIQDIDRVINDFKNAAERVLKSGFDVLEIHGAHGYLIHEFLSPISNKRTDKYGGSFENRTRFLKQIVQNIRQVWPAEKPLFVRLSCTDWISEEISWDLNQTLSLTKELRELGVDLIDCSSGGTSPKQKITTGLGYQVQFSEAVRQHNNNGLFTGAVGLITSPEQANEIIKDDKADLVFLAREFLRTPNFVLKAAQELKVKVKYAQQYERGRRSFD